ncbi:MAG: response regulator [Termitinemataceae bacterium]
MRRILLVDDEQPIITALQLLLRRYFAEDFTVVGTAVSGREAIEKSQELQPDILLMDVQMPGISGLDAIRTIVGQGKPKAFILVTAYERFDIAREALSLGVCDYILKPVSRERLDMALKAANLYLDRIQELERIRLEYNDREHRLYPLIKDALLYRIRASLPYEWDLNLIRQTLKLQTDNAAIVLVYLYVPGLYVNLKEYIGYKTEAILGELEDDRYCMILVPIKQAQGLETFLQGLRGQFRTEIELGDLVVSAGSPQSLTNLSVSWKDAVASFMMAAKPQEGESRLAWPMELDIAILQSLRQNNIHQTIRNFEALVSHISEQSGLGQDSLYRILAILTTVVIFIGQTAKLSDQDIQSLLDFDELVKLWNGGAAKLLVQGLRSRFYEIIDRSKRSQAYSPAIKKALQYIENHFADPISLEQVADILGMAPASLSRLFSEELGVGFAKTLIDYRLTRAKELLKRKDLSIKDISIACGYQDPNYFTRLFKSYTGITPSEYAHQEGGDL